MPPSTSDSNKSEQHASGNKTNPHNQQQEEPTMMELLQRMQRMEHEHAKTKAELRECKSELSRCRREIRTLKHGDRCVVKVCWDVENHWRTKSFSMMGWNWQLMTTRDDSSADVKRGLFLCPSNSTKVFQVDFTLRILPASAHGDGNGGSMDAGCVKILPPMTALEQCWGTTHFTSDLDLYNNNLQADNVSFVEVHFKGYPSVSEMSQAPPAYPAFYRGYY